MTKSNINLKDSIASLNKSVVILQTESSTLKEKISSFEKESNDLKTANQQLTVTNTELNAKLKTVTDEFEALTTNYDKLLKDYDSLKKKSEEPKPSSQSSDGSKTAYLTFDDGVSKYTNTILDILKEYDVKATFFPNWKSGNDELYKRIVNEGHALGNHTYDHVYESVYSTVDGFINEVTKFQNKIKSVTGYTPELFRFPGGSNNTISKKFNSAIIPQAIDAIHDLGLEYYDWNVDSADATSVTPLAADTIAANVLSGSGKKKVIIIIMHDSATKSTTVDALPKIIEELIEKGYTLKKLTKEVIPIQFIKP